MVACTNTKLNHMTKFKSVEKVFGKKSDDVHSQKIK